MKQETKPVFQKELKNLVKSFVKILRAIPRQIYAILIIIILSLFLMYFFTKNEIKSILPKNLPSAQIVNDLDNPSCSYAYDNRTKNPAWVGQVLFLNKDKNLKSFQFYEDKSIPESFRSKLSDYENSGFDIAPLLDQTDEGDFSHSKISLSTCCPQVPQFNRGYWSKVRSYVREDIAGFGKEARLKRVLVISGPLYLPHETSDGKRYVTYQIIGENEIAVPTHFFKALFYFADPLDYSRIESEFYIIPNQNLNEDISLESFKTTRENLEKRAGIIFPKDIKEYLIPPPPPGKMM